MADRHSAFGLLFTTLLKLPRHVEVTDDPEVEVAHVRLTKPWVRYSHSCIPCFSNRGTTYLL